MYVDVPTPLLCIGANINHNVTFETTTACILNNINDFLSHISKSIFRLQQLATFPSLVVVTSVSWD